MSVLQQSSKFTENFISLEKLFPEEIASTTNHSFRVLINQISSPDEYSITETIAFMSKNKDSFEAFWRITEIVLQNKHRIDLKIIQRVLDIQKEIGVPLTEKKLEELTKNLRGANDGVGVKENTRSVQNSFGFRLRNLVLVACSFISVGGLVRYVNNVYHTDEGEHSYNLLELQESISNLRIKLKEENNIAFFDTFKKLVDATNFLHRINPASVSADSLLKDPSLQKRVLDECQADIGILENPNVKFVLNQYLFEKPSFIDLLLITILSQQRDFDREITIFSHPPYYKRILALALQGKLDGKIVNRIIIKHSEQGAAELMHSAELLKERGIPNDQIVMILLDELEKRLSRISERRQETHELSIEERLSATEKCIANLEVTGEEPHPELKELLNFIHGFIEAK